MFPESVASKGIFSIFPPRPRTEKRSAFLDNEKIEHLYIEDGISEIGLCAFAGCKKLENARLPEEVSLFEDSIFISCQGLSDVSLPSNLSEIPLSCFDSCTSLAHISLPEGLKSIGYSAFNLCTSLKFLTLPDFQLHGIDRDHTAGLSGISWRLCLLPLQRSDFGSYFKESFEN